MKLQSKKCLLILSTIVIMIICIISETNWKYVVAGIFNSDSNISSNVIFLEDSGFYDEEFYLTIYAPTDEIYYIIDGSDPTKESLKYESRILIKDATENPNTYSMRTDVSAELLKEEVQNMKVLS